MLEAKTWRPKARPPEQTRGKRNSKSDPQETDRQGDSRSQRLRSKSPPTRAPENGEERERTAASGASTPVLTKVKRLQAKIDKEKQR